MSKRIAAAFFWLTLSSNLSAYEIESYRVIDGDTISARVKLGLNTSRTIGIRMLGYNSPEIRNVDRIEKMYGRRSTIHLKSLLQCKGTLDVTSTKRGKYGRWLGTVYCNQININRLMIRFEDAQKIKMHDLRNSI